jgi:hypothetical protein
MLKQEHIRGNPTEMLPKWMEADSEVLKKWIMWGSLQE